MHTMTTMKTTTPTVVGSTVLMSSSRVARSMAAREDSVTSAGGALLVRDWGVDQRGKLESGPMVVRVGRYMKPGWNTRLAPAYTCRVTYIQACDIYRRVWSLFNKIFTQLRKHTQLGYILRTLNIMTELLTVMFILTEVDRNPVMLMASSGMVKEKPLSVTCVTLTCFAV